MLMLKYRVKAFASQKKNLAKEEHIKWFLQQQKKTSLRLQVPNNFKSAPKLA